ncbi:SAM domain-containing protein SAMSN-1b isoform X2 [Oncorhynchus clarkii lewisi]|uniref:SAM domain-containing protein SAMSN-1b isoform X2 n=1 Tax=Oncorhynchus clarkii lewisi TaxID=490388 RepID=UPI0039B847D3
MNLFCFSLEGSTDSLYEPALNKHPVIQEHSCRVPSRHNSRHSSPALRDRAKWRGSDPCIPTELSEAHKSHLKKKKRRSHVPTTSTSDNETIDNTDTNVYWQSLREKQDFVHIKNNHKEEMGQGPCQRSVLAVEDRVEQLNSERREKEPTTQGVNFEAWNPNYEPPDSHQQNMNGDAEADMAESKGKLKRFQRLVKVKKGSQMGLDDGKTDSNCHLADSVFSNDSPVITCIGLGKKTEKKSSKADPPSPQKQQTKEANGKAVEGPWSTVVHDHHWGLTEFPPPWDVPYHTCHRPPGEPRNYGFDFTLPRATAWDHFESLVQELDSKQAPPVFSHQRVIRSITDLDISESTRSTSFGRFDSLRHQPAPVKPEENGSALSAEGEQVNSDQTRSGGIGKKMKAISLTMRKRMGRQYAKALSEEMCDETERDEEGEGDVVYGVHSFPKGHRKSSHSLESLYSLNSGQSSSSGVTSGSDGSSNRDSLRLDEELPLSYTGQFCGRARVHTDFVPSPYDTESLKLKVGDVIEIISKPPMGIWTGMLNNKVGNFKFIYVDLIVEKVPEPPQKMTHRRSRRPRPKTLQELLERLNLEEYASSLLLNGYQTVDDLRELKEQHLVELNVTDSEHRHRLMAAVECLQEPQSDGQKEGELNKEAKSPTESIKADLNCPRDSGCYMPSDCSDNSKEETDIHVPAALNHHPPMAQT